MAVFKNTSANDRDIPLLGLLARSGDTFDVPDDLADGFRSQPEFVEQIPAPSAPTPLPDPIAPSTTTEGAV